MINRGKSFGPTGLLSACLLLAAWTGPASAQSDPAQRGLTSAVCVDPALAAAIPREQIGEPVGGVVLDAVTWVAATDNAPAHCRVDGQLTPVDRSTTARPIRFGVALPAAWNGRAIQMGGGGMNGAVPGIAGGFGGPSNLSRGFVTYGSDSGHSVGDSEWALNDEAIMNLGYLQMKKTHDVAMVLVERAYGQLPEYNYYVGGSQGGREGLAVAQRYPEDYDGVLSTVPIVGFSSLMLSRALMRIEERQLSRHVPPVKGNAVLAEFMRRCDDLDGLVDGVINNYFDCRAIFNINDGIGDADPWAARRCPGDVDPDPADATQDACLTSGQIRTLEYYFSSFVPEASLANGRTSFGMWSPTSAVGNVATLSGTAPEAPAAGSRFGGPGGFGGGIPGGGGGGMLIGQRYQGQEGAAEDAPVFSNLGSLGVVGFMMQDIDADPLDFSIDRFRERREQVSEWLDTTDPDLRAFHQRGGKLIVIVGTDDTTAPSGEQQSFYQTVIDFMGRDVVDEFARLYVLPQTGHGLTGRSAAIDGAGARIRPAEIPSSTDRFGLLQAWVESGVAPGMSEVVTGNTGSRPMCSYPEYPRYGSGDPDQAESYRCARPDLVPENK